MEYSCGQAPTTWIRREEEHEGWKAQGGSEGNGASGQWAVGAARGLSRGEKAASLGQASSPAPLDTPGHWDHQDLLYIPSTSPTTSMTVIIAERLDPDRV